METFSITTADTLGWEPLAAFIEPYRVAHPTAKVQETGFYLFHPAYQRGAMLLCATVGADPVRVVGVAPIYQDLEADPPECWTAIIVDPEDQQAGQLRRSLLSEVVRRLAAPSEPRNAGPQRLCVDLNSTQKTELGFLLDNGFTEFGRFHQMRLRPVEPVVGSEPAVGSASVGEVRIGPWRLETGSERQLYLDAFRQCLPETPMTDESLGFIASSPPLETGTFLGAFDPGGNLVGSIMVCPESGSEWIMDYVFVLQQWRRRGIGRQLVARGLEYLQKHGGTEARLTVRTDNRAAIATYQSAGFTATDVDEIHLDMLLQPA